MDFMVMVLILVQELTSRTPSWSSMTPRCRRCGTRPGS